MEFCNNSCCFGPLSTSCKSQATVKINFSGYHKVCLKHSSELSNRLECQFCKSISLVVKDLIQDKNSNVSIKSVPEVVVDSPESLEISNLNSNKSEPFDKYHSSEMSEVDQISNELCPSCNKIQVLHLLKCSHKACLSCFSKRNCKVCENVLEGCINCGKVIQKFALFSCTHTACSTCIDKTCNHCNHLKNKKECSKCKLLKFLYLPYDFDKAYRNKNICHHPVCMICLTSNAICKLCKENPLKGSKVVEKESEGQSKSINLRSFQQKIPDPSKRAKILCFECLSSEHLAGYECGHKICMKCKVQDKDTCEICKPGGII